MDNDRRPAFHRNGRSGTPLLFEKKPSTPSPSSPNGTASRFSSSKTARHGPPTSSSSKTARHAPPPSSSKTARHAPPPSSSSSSPERWRLRRPSSTMHSRHPSATVEAAKASARKKYLVAALFLSVSLVAFCLQTELSAYIQHDLGWSKAYCMMYVTHSSWVVLWPVALLALRLQKRDEPWARFWRKHVDVVLSTVTMIELQTVHVVVTAPSVARRGRPLVYLARMTIYITSALTIAGLSWYIAVSLTTPSDLTAIYNCSAFFAYAFSVPILKEPLRTDKSLSVLVAILGVLVVAYGDTGPEPPPTESSDGNAEASSRLAGNLVIGLGSVLYGLYEVLYKRYACPPEGVSPLRGTLFANVFGSCIGAFTLTVLWLPLPLLHWLRLETFEVPAAATCWLILLAVLSNALFSGCFLVLISLTSPVLSSVAALLTIFVVALADWFRTGQPLSWAAIVGGSMIVVAFAALSWSTYREMMAQEVHKVAVDLTDDESDLEGALASDEDEEADADGHGPADARV